MNKNLSKTRPYLLYYRDMLPASGTIITITKFKQEDGVFELRDMFQGKQLVIGEGKKYIYCMENSKISVPLFEGFPTFLFKPII